MSTRRCSRPLLLLFLLAVLALPATSWAADSVAKLATTLLRSDDFRLRTQAALALGASGSAKAVKPLCKGLDDTNDAVRAAVAAGLGKLQRGGVDCMKKRLKKEKSRNVKKMLSKAIRLVKEAAAGPRLGRSTKVYVPIAPPRNKTGRSDLASVVRAAMVSAMSRQRGYVVAPVGETPQQAKKRLRKHHHIDAYLLAATLHPPKYGGNQLSVRIEVELFGYPDKNLQGSVGRSSTMPGVGSKNKDKESELFTAVAKAAVAEFVKLAAQVN